MAWKIEFSPKAKKQLLKINTIDQTTLDKFLNDKLPKTSNPKSLGASLQGNLKGFWRYRVGDYRIICQIKERQLIVLVVKIGHRKDIYN